jgi:hypothetical protein
VFFLDESGSISADRFFSVGCLKLQQPSVLIRAIEKWRDQEQWYEEIHFVDLTLGTVPRYKTVIDIVAAAACEFACFVADRQAADPVSRFGSQWKAYEKLAAQLIIGSIKPGEVVSVLADAYSAPDGILIEEELQAEVNRRLRRFAVLPVVRLNSKAALPLQIVDLLTSAVTFEFRQSAGLAGKETPKAQVAKHFRDRFGIPTFLGGHVQVEKVRVELYRGASAPSPARTLSSSP